MTRALAIVLLLSATGALARPKESRVARCQTRCAEEQKVCGVECKKAAPNAGAICGKECGKLQKSCAEGCTERPVHHKPKPKKGL